jgi:hypothetical protein
MLFIAPQEIIMKGNLILETSYSSGLYLYGIIPTGENIIFALPGAGAEIIDVFTVPYHCPLSALPREQGIAGVVSASPLQDFDGQPTDAYQVTHLRVVLAVEQFYPVLPVHFGTVMACELEVRQYLSQHYDEIQAAWQGILCRVEGDRQAMPSLHATIPIGGGQIDRQAYQMINA